MVRSVGQARIRLGMEVAGDEGRQLETKYVSRNRSDLGGSVGS